MPSVGSTVTCLAAFAPFKQAAHGVEEVPRLRGRCGAAVTAGDDHLLRDRADRLVCCGFDHLLEMVFAIATRRQRQIGPCGRLAVAFDQPSKRASRRTSVCGARIGS